MITSGWYTPNVKSYLVRGTHKDFPLKFPRIFQCKWRTLIYLNPMPFSIGHKGALGAFVINRRKDLPHPPVDRYQQTAPLICRLSSRISALWWSSSFCTGFCSQATNKQFRFRLSNQYLFNSTDNSQDSQQNH